MEPYDDRDPQHVQSAPDPKGLRRDLSLQTKGPIISSSGVPGGLAPATSSQMQFRGDHLHLSENYGVLKMLNKLGKAIIFPNSVTLNTNGMCDEAVALYLCASLFQFKI